MNISIARYTVVILAAIGNDHRRRHRRHGRDSSLGHVRRAVLFSLYPDNAAMGRHLGETAQEFLASGDYGEHGMVLLREVLQAVNLRTAMHLGLDVSAQQGFDMVFPEK
jgi:putative ABC transport system substrate-binding protein